MSSYDVLSTVNSTYPSPDTILCVETAPALLQDQGAVFVRLLPLANAPTAEVQTTGSVKDSGSKRALTVFTSLIVSWHSGEVPEPAQAPPHPAKTESGPAQAKILTTLPSR